MILDDTGFQPMSDLATCGVSIKPTPLYADRLHDHGLSKGRSVQFTTLYTETWTNWSYKSQLENESLYVVT